MLHLAPWPAVLVAAAVCFVIGGLWFSPILFGTRWLQELHVANPEASRAVGALLALPAAFVAALVLGLLIRSAGVSSAAGGAGMGVIVWGGFGIAIHLPAIFLERAPARTAIDAGHKFVVYVAMGAIIGAWI